MTRDPRRAVLAALVVGTLSVPVTVLSQAAPRFSSTDLRTWLTYIASDELGGRATYSPGLRLAADYIRAHLEQWGVQPGGDGGSYLQTVHVRQVRATSRSSLTVRVGATTRSFKDGDGVRFPRNAGAPRTFTLNRVEFVGYGIEAPGAGHSDFRGRDVSGAAVVFVGANAPRTLDQESYRRLLSGRSRYALDQLRAAAAVGPQVSATGRNRRAGGTAADDSESAADFTTAGSLDLPVAPGVTASDEVFEFMFSRARVRYADLQQRAGRREPLPAFRLDDVSLTFHIEADYAVLGTDLTQNVVAVVPGSDPALNGTYVAFGAHYDHVGTAAEPSATGNGGATAPGRIAPGSAADRIWNGADDDASGTVALMAIARAFAQGPRPRRSLLFVWHAGEERGLLGSRYFADHPTVPLDRIVAHLNLDMVGRNRDDLPSEAETVYLVGSDRISSELHEISRSANRSLARPMRLDYELNDPADREQLYTRSDHYNYAVKGIPIIFFTTGLHSDYHANTDHSDKIEFDKMARVTELVFETGRRLANLDHPPARDHRGARAGKGAP